MKLSNNLFQVRDFLFWCNEAEQEIVTIEPIAKTAAEAFVAMDQRYPTGQVNGTHKVSESIDCSQAELLQARYFRMSEELQQHWKPTSMQLVGEAESMIDDNHYAAADVSVYTFLHFSYISENMFMYTFCIIAEE